MKRGKLFIIIFIVFSATAFGQNNPETGNITESILNDRDNFYFLDTQNYPIGDKSLPVGVFDSGIGGLTVLDAIVNFDEFHNQDHTSGADGKIDFEEEKFIYLADQANMPYGNYSAENKEGLLREHIVKDVQFLMGNKYYATANDNTFQTNKSPVKAIVIACNTATAYGKSTIEDFIEKAGLDIKVIGVIDAGVRGALEELGEDEDATIGVMATVGTVSSKGYVNTIYQQKDELGYTGNIEVFQQGGIGIAEAVDEDSDYFDKELTSPRENYKGPGLRDNSGVKIEKTLMDIYNFDFEDYKMLCDASGSDDCDVLQINDAENYVRFHLVSLLEKIRIAGVQQPLKSIILGCTHYPYLIDEIEQVLDELYNYKDENKNFRYRGLMAKNISLIDPALNTAKELFEHLKNEKLFNENGNIKDSEFYISVANRDNPDIALNDRGNFPYEYKYGREEGKIQEYVKVVPFSRSNISEDILIRLEDQLPFTYELIEEFNKENQKTLGLEKDEKI